MCSSDLMLLVVVVVVLVLLFIAQARTLVSQKELTDNPNVRLIMVALGTASSAKTFADKAPVPEEEFLIPFGEANILREGNDVTLIGTSSMRQVCEKAAELLEADGISAEVMDPRTIVPLDEDTLLASARKTSRVIVVDEGHQSYGVTAEIAARINEKAFYHLDAPVIRMGAMDVPVPFSPALEDLTVPTPEGVAANARKLMSGEMIHAA